MLIVRSTELAEQATYGGSTWHAMQLRLMRNHRRLTGGRVGLAVGGLVEPDLRNDRMSRFGSDQNRAKLAIDGCSVAASAESA
jgi:hypothetical protein